MSTNKNPQGEPTKEPKKRGLWPPQTPDRHPPNTDDQNPTYLPPPMVVHHLLHLYQRIIVDLLEITWIVVLRILRKSREIWIEDLRIKVPREKHLPDAKNLLSLLLLLFLPRLFLGSFHLTSLRLF